MSTDLISSLFIKQYMFLTDTSIVGFVIILHTLILLRVQFITFTLYLNFTIFNHYHFSNFLKSFMSVFLQTLLQRNFPTMF